MKHATKILLIVAACLFAIGSAMVLTAFALVGFRPQELQFGVEYTEHTVQFDADEITALEADTGSWDLHLIGDDVDEVTVRYYDSDRSQLEVTLQDGTLCLRTKSSFSLNPRYWFNLDFSGRSYDIEIRLPRQQLQQLRAACGSGSVRAEGLTICGDVELQAGSGDISAKELIAQGELTAAAVSGAVQLSDCAITGDTAVSASSGDLRLTRLNAQSLDLAVNSGGVKLTDCSFDGAVNLRASSGDIDFTNLQAGDITATCSSGSISGTLTDPEKYLYQTDTGSGSVRVPQSELSAQYICRVQTSSGDIKIH